MLIKYLRLIVAVVNAFQILWFKFPRASREKKLALIQNWSNNFLKVLGLHLHVEPSHESRQASAVNLVVSNHVSWLDVLVIQSICPSVFVAKLEVQRWPMIGHLSTACGVIFVDRGSTQSARKMVDDVAAAYITATPWRVFLKVQAAKEIRCKCFMPISLKLPSKTTAAYCPWPCAIPMRTRTPYAGKLRL